MELRHLHQKVGLTFVMVTHDQDEALAMADRVLVMRDGKVVQDGSTEDLYDRPATPYVAGFVGSTNLFSSSVAAGRVDCFGQELTLPTNLASRANGLFGFRPEKAHFLSPDENSAETKAGNILRGTVEEVFYHGSIARIVLKLAHGTILLELQNKYISRRGGLPRLGTELAVSVAPEVIMAFDAEAAA